MSGHRTPTLVALHGHGDDPSTARRWGLELAPPGWRVEVPEAPLDADGAPSWFDSGPRGADAASLRRSLDQVARVVAEAAQDGPVVVAGFSQGAALALALGPLPGLDSVVALCPFVVELGDEVAGADGPPALLLPGAQDELVPAFVGEDGGAALAAGGRDVTVDVLPGGHVVSPVAMERARAWMLDGLSDRMRVSIGLPTERVDTGAELVSGPAVAELAGAFEEAGYDALYVTDHPAPDDRWLAGGGHQALEPTVALTAAAMATSSILLHTHVYVLGYRNPFLAAKALASVDVLSGGRLVVGVAAGYLRPEFAALGAGFEDRGARLDEALALLPRIWGEDRVAVEGHGFASRGVTARPRPAQHPHPPLWVGGNSDAAIRRAVRLAQGWSPFPTPAGLERATRTASIADLDELDARLARLDEICAREGRDDRPTVCFSPFSSALYQQDPSRGIEGLVAEVAALRERGVDWVTVAVPGRARDEIVERAGELAEALGLSRR